MKDVERWTIYFCTFWHLIHLHPLTNTRDMVISMLADQVLKMTHKPIDLKAIANSQYCMCLYDRNFKSAVWSYDCSCSESLLYVLQNVPLVDSMIYLSPWSFTLPSYRFEFGGHKKHTPILDAAMLNRRRCHFQNLIHEHWNNHIPDICQWISMNKVSKCAEI